MLQRSKKKFWTENSGLPETESKNMYKKNPSKFRLSTNDM